jgi:hypothetical protein
MEDKYSYEVHPRIPIKNVIPGKGIFRPTVLDLTKDEVVKCLKCGPVFRNFGKGDQVQVTLYNIDELHVAHYVAPSKTKAIDPSKKTDVAGIIVPKKEFVPHIIAPTKKEEPVKEQVEEVTDEVAEESVEKAVVEEEKVEEPVVEAPVEEAVDAVEEAEASEEEKAEEVIDEEVEESVEESEEEAEEAPVAGQPNPNNRRKKKHH